MSDITREKVANLKHLLASIGDLPWFLSDCEGLLGIWRESALKGVHRDEHGEVDGYTTPGSYKRCDLVAEWELDTWDEGDDADDDERRRQAELIVEAVNVLPALLAIVEAARALYRSHATQGSLSTEQAVTLMYEVQAALYALTPEQVAVLAGDDAEAAQAETADDGDDGTCGDCMYGRCHGTEPEECGCARHEASVEAAQAEQSGGGS